MAEGAQTLNQRIQEQTMKSAQDFYNDSIGRVKDLLHSDRAELESLLEHLPESQREAKAQVQEMVDSYVAFESTLDEMARAQGSQVQGGRRGKRGDPTGAGDHGAGGEPHPGRRARRGH